jgi:hypothetical protein
MTFHRTSRIALLFAVAATALFGRPSLAFSSEAQQMCTGDAMRRTQNGLSRMMCNAEAIFLLDSVATPRSDRLSDRFPGSTAISSG